ncbi:MAG: hypothetical protein LBU16_04415, partial [Treponema sp.]|nr:hypothetical protein [Treponema sp.]
MNCLHRVLFGFCVAAVLSAPVGAQTPVETLEQLDGETTKLGEAIAQKLLTLGTGVRIRTEDFYCEGNETGLGTYLSNQLAAILANRSDGGYTVVAGPDASAPGENGYALDGEILRLGAAIRVYARLIRSGDSTLAAVWNADFAPTSFLEDLVVFAPSSSDIRVRRDSYEPDSVDAPVPAAAGVWISRTIHQDDGDWFRVAAENAGLLITETADSSFDPKMELYDQSGRSRLDSDDDDGEGYNPRIEAEANAGQVFIVKVLGYDSSETGEYRFRATLETAAEDATEPNDTIA